LQRTTFLLIGVRGGGVATSWEGELLRYAPLDKHSGNGGGSISC